MLSSISKKPPDIVYAAMDLEVPLGEIVDKPHNVDKLVVLDHELAVARAKIIDDILTDGLKSGQQLAREGKPYFGALDREPLPRPYWATLSYESADSNDHTTLAQRINASLYHGPTSVLPVMAERRWEHVSPLNVYKSAWGTEAKQRGRELMQRRAQSSILIVFRDDNKYLTEEAASSGHRIDTIDPADFVCIVIPKDIAERYCKVKSGSSEFAVPIRIVDYTPRILAMREDLVITVPDYESTVIEESQRLGKVSFSGIRLPADEDDLIRWSQT